MSITIQIDSNLEHTLRTDAEKRGMSVEQMVGKLLEKEFRKMPSNGHAVSKRESELLQRVNLDIKPEVWGRYQELKSKRKAMAMSELELKEYQGIIEQIESANADRLKVLAEIASIRRVPLRQLMRDLGLANTPHD